MKRCLPVYEKLIGRGVDDRVAARMFEAIHERGQREEGGSFHRRELFV